MALLTEQIVLTPKSAERAWLPGLLHVLAAFAPAPVFGVAVCVSGLLVASLVSFVVFLPLTVLTLNNGAAIPEDVDPPALPLGARVLLFVLWVATAWSTAGSAALLG
jgi:hypothetical protein